MIPTIVKMAWSQFSNMNGSVLMSLVIALVSILSGFNGQMNLQGVTLVIITRQCMVVTNLLLCHLFLLPDSKAKLFADKELILKLTSWMFKGLSLSLVFMNAHRDTGHVLTTTIGQI